MSVSDQNVPKKSMSEAKNSDSEDEIKKQQKAMKDHFKGLGFKGMSTKKDEKWEFLFRTPYIIKNGPIFDQIAEA